MKKIIALASILALALCAIACGDDGKKEGCLNCACKATAPKCDNNLLKCTDNVCVACTAGSLDCACKSAEPKCDNNLVCTNTICTTPATCCSGEAKHISVAGTVLELKLDGAPAPILIPLAAVSPIAALGSSAGTNPDPIEATAITTSTAGTGAFKIDCFSVDGVAIGLIILADDDPGDTYFPAFTGVAGWSDPANATCLTGSRVFAMKTAAITQLAALINAAHTGLDFDPATDGIILGMTMGPTAMPIGDAVVLKEGTTPVEPPNICYVNATGAPPNVTLSCGTKTSAQMGGLFVIPGPFGGGFSPPTLIAQKTGCTWASGRFKASSAAGKAFILGLVADSCTP